jgi:hypothetical protein
LGYGLTEQETLHEVTISTAKKYHLLIAFHTLCHYVKSEAV